MTQPNRENIVPQHIMNTLRNLVTGTNQFNIPELTTIPRQIVRQNNVYHEQNQPTLDEYQFNPTQTNTDLIQASVETARAIYAPFELYIQLAQHLGNVEINGIFPSYLRDASPYEIFKIYTGEPIFRARQLIDDIVYYEATDVHDANNVLNFMGERGYLFSYVGFVRADHPGQQAYRHETPLTPANFHHALTHDQEILMEAWRLKALHGAVSHTRNIHLLDIKDILRQNDNDDANVYHRRRTDFAPINAFNGFSKASLREAIINASRELPPADGVGGHRNHITREYIRYEGEKAVRSCSSIPINISTFGLPMNRHIPKAYYMMLYNELAIRGVIQ